MYACGSCFVDLLHCQCRICPIFQVSNVTGENLDLLRTFLSLLCGRMHGNEDKPAEFQIDETYSVPVSRITSKINVLYLQLLFC